MNSRVAISLGLSILAHGLIFWILIMTFPGSVSKPSPRIKSHVLTIDFLKPQVAYKPDSVIALEDNAERIANQLAEDSAGLEGRRKHTVADNSSDVVSLVVPEPKYYTLTELDQAPVIIQNINTNPPELLKYAEGGQLTIRLWIDEEGNVIKAELVKSQLPPQFADSTLASFLRAKFSPGMKANLPVRSVVKMVVQYAAISHSAD